MRELIHELIECLGLETERYRRLGLLADQQKELLVAGKMEELPANVRLEEKEMFALSPLLDRRGKALERIAGSLGLRSLTLSEVLEKAPAEATEGLKAAMVDLVSAAKSLEEINKGNEKLLQNAIAYVNFTLQVLAEGGKTAAVKNSAAEEKPKSVFVNRIV